VSSPSSGTANVSSRNHVGKQLEDNDANLDGQLPNNSEHRINQLIATICLTTNRYG